MGNDQKSAEQAYAAAASTGFGVSAPFVCPYPDCRVYAEHEWGSVAVLLTSGGQAKNVRSSSNKPQVVLARCQSCDREVIFADERLICPLESEAPVPVPDMPEDALGDFNEARQIYQASPRGAAALLRLAIEKLCPVLGATAPDINSAIGQLVQAQRITPELQQALDSVRVIGNEAVHPGTMDLRDDRDMALVLFDLVNFIVEKGVSEPKRIAAIYATLPPAKLKGIENRDGPASPD